MVVQLALAGRQVWPLILSTLHTRPDLLVVLHSSAEAESKQPAERFKALTEKYKDLFHFECELCEMPHDNFTQAIEILRQVIRDKLTSGSSCVINITGGNKLMATAGYECGRQINADVVYLERGNKLINLMAEDAEGK